jgi:hypothetical protein
MGRQREAAAAHCSVEERGARELDAESGCWVESWVRYCGGVVLIVLIVACGSQWEARAEGGAGFRAFGAG